MREFCVVPHGAGKNFLGALQHYIEGTLTRDRITNRISETNQFDMSAAFFFYERCQTLGIELIMVPKEVHGVDVHVYNQRICDLSR